MLPRDPPAEAVQHLLDQIAPVHLERIWVRGVAHLAPHLSCSSDVDRRALGSGHEPRKLVQPVLDLLVVRERSKIVHEELQVVVLAAEGRTGFLHANTQQLDPRTALAPAVAAASVQRTRCAPGAREAVGRSGQQHEQRPQGDRAHGDHGTVSSTADPTATREAAKTALQLTRLRDRNGRPRKSDRVPRAESPNR